MRSAVVGIAIGLVHRHVRSLTVNIGRLLAIIANRLVNIGYRINALSHLFCVKNTGVCQATVNSATRKQPEVRNSVAVASTTSIPTTINEKKSTPDDTIERTGVER